MKTEPPADFGNDAVSQSMKPLNIDKIKRDAFTAGRVAGLRDAAESVEATDAYGMARVWSVRKQLHDLADKIEADAVRLVFAPATHQEKGSK